MRAWKIMLSVTSTFFDKCISRMICTLRENNLIDEFIASCDNHGYMCSDNPMITRLANLVSDGHSGASFALCCRFVRIRLIEKRVYRARFKGIVRAIIVLRRLRVSAAERVYSPPTDGESGGCGYALAARDFVNRVTNECAAPGLPPVPTYTSVPSPSGSGYIK